MGIEELNTMDRGWRREKEKEKEKESIVGEAAGAAAEVGMKTITIAATVCVSLSMCLFVCDFSLSLSWNEKNFGKWKFWNWKRNKFGQSSTIHSFWTFFLSFRNIFIFFYFMLLLDDVIWFFFWKTESKCKKVFVFYFFFYLIRKNKIQNMFLWMLNFFKKFNIFILFFQIYPLLLVVSFFNIEHSSY